MNARTLSVLVAAMLAPSFAAAESVVTYHNGNHRHGAYVVPTLTLAAAANMQRDAKFSAKITGHVYAQPLYWNPRAQSVRS